MQQNPRTSLTHKQLSKFVASDFALRRVFEEMREDVSYCVAQCGMCLTLLLDIIVQQCKVLKDDGRERLLL